nr:site-specific DNA-methyltransferase [Candidatus Njordarchaeum guaymaensis]
MTRDAARKVTLGKYELSYEGKESKEDILAGGSMAKLREVGLHGEKGFPDSSWANMLVLGDNFVVSRALMNEPSVLGNVRLVYIDPPFSTGQDFRVGGTRSSTISSSKSDEVAYEDRLAGASYFEFLRKRLIRLREILTDNGSIYVHVDCKVGHYVKVLMDEVFGEDHFINDVSRIKCNPKNFPRKAYGNIKDMILFYSKTNDYVWNDPREPFTQEDIQRLFPKIDNKGRRYTTNPLHAPGETGSGPTGQPWRGIPPPEGRHWRSSPKALEELDRRELIVWSDTGVPRKKIYADELLKKGKKRQDVWEFKDPQFPSYPTEKSMEMLKVIIQASSSPGDIVLDAFCGSGTTLLAAEQLDRRWIGIDNSSSAIKTTSKKLLESRRCKFFKLLELVD